MRLACDGGSALDIECRDCADGVNEPNVNGIIPSDDGRTVLFELRGRSFPPEVGRSDRQIYGSITFHPAAEAEGWLNLVCAV